MAPFLLLVSTDIHTHTMVDTSSEKGDGQLKKSPEISCQQHLNNNISSDISGFFLLSVNLSAAVFVDTVTVHGRLSLNIYLPVDNKG